MSSGGGSTVAADRIGREVSVRAVIALWEALRSRGLDPTALAVGTGHSEAQLLDRHGLVSWAVFHRLMSNLGTLVSDDVLVEMGREAVDSPFFRGFVLPGRYLFGAPDVYRWCFGPNGPAHKMITACEAKITNVAPGRVRFETWVKPGYEPSRENLLLLKGTLIGIGTAFGGRECTIDMQLTERGAVYDIRVARRNALLDVARQYAGPLRNWVLARTSAHAELNARNEELEREVNTRIRAEAEQRASEERYRQLFARVPLPMLLFDLDTLKILAVNKAAVQHYGYSRAEWTNMTIADIRPAEDVPALLSDLERHIDSPKIWRHRKRDGSIILVEITTRGVELEGKRAAIVIANDVTARVHLEERLREAQKVEAVGRLAGGVAHDFNNLMTVIINASVGALRVAGLPQRVQRELEAIQAAAERGVELTRRLLTLSNRPHQAQPALDLSELLRDMHKLIVRAVSEQIHVVIVAARPVAVLGIDRESVERIVMNLVVNARDAMPTGGTIVLEAQLVELNDTTPPAAGAVKPGAYAVLAVSDSGGGIDAETKARIFEPYFTTKAERGTGLGLATVREIVENVGGHVRVDTAPGRGARFEIYLPVEPARGDELSHESAAATYSGTGSPQ